MGTVNDIATLGVLAGVAYLLFERKASAGDLDPDLPDVTPKDPVPTPEPVPAATQPVEGNWLGTGWDGWPRKDLFPAELSFAQFLKVLGYVNAPSELLDQNNRWVQNDFARGVVISFQNDFNTADAIQDWSHPTLKVDGKLGPWTASAMVKVSQEIACKPEAANAYAPLRAVCLAAWTGLQTHKV